MLPLLVVVLFGGLRTLIYLQNQQIQSIANQQTAPSVQPKSTIDNNNKPGQSNPSPSAAPGPQAQKPEPPQKAKPQPATAKPKKLKNEGQTKTQTSSKKSDHTKQTTTNQIQNSDATKTKEPASPFMRQYTKDKEPKRRRKPVYQSQYELDNVVTFVLDPVHVSHLDTGKNYVEVFT